MLYSVRDSREKFSFISLLSSIEGMFSSLSIACLIIPIILCSTTSPVDEDLKSCCGLGQQWADEQRDGCDNFPIPVPNVKVEHQTLCIASVEICCTRQRRLQQCALGKDVGRQGRQCLKLSGVGGEAFQDCCLGCKLGLQISSSTRNCQDLGAELFSSPWSESFIECCLELQNGTFTEPDDDRRDDETETRCPRGFRYNSRLNVCDDIDECDEPSHDCDDEVEICRNTIGGFICEELQRIRDEMDGAGGRGQQGGEDCPEGFRFFLVSCIDVDECLDGTHDCQAQESCHNTEGGFECRRRESGGSSSTTAIKCPSGFSPNPTSGLCEDINECHNDQHNCLESQRCDNTIGSFTCVRYTTCGTGYTLNSDTGRCEDDDECAIGTHNCQQLGPEYICHNTQGSFRCEKRKCGVGEILNPEDGLCSILRCQTGFEPSESGSCVDIDECDYENACERGSVCENTMGSYECVSQCQIGLQVDPMSNNCVDIDECETGLARCFGGRRCVNTIGSYICSCPDGFRLNSVSGRCEDIDECDRLGRTSVCGIDSECQNSMGSYRCVCKSGFRRFGGSSGSASSCVDINECLEIANVCQQRCTNLWGSYRCHCRSGFMLGSDQRSCIDVDECRDYDDLCIGHCVNEPGSYRCSCPQGYVLSSNERSCQDVDECRERPLDEVCPTSDPSRNQYQHCFNTRGGFKCTDISCPDGYVREEGHGRRCRRISTRCPLTDIDCQRKPVSVSYNFIALISNLKVQGPNGVNLFTMQSARYPTLTTKFTLKVKDVRAPQDVRKAVRADFRLKTASHSAILSLVRPIKGPQDVQLELLMEMYHLGRFQASASANIYIFVSPYEF